MHRIFLATLGVFFFSVSPVSVWAQAIASETSSFKPNDRAATLFFQGQVFAREGKLDSAIDAYMGALALDPQYIQARLSLAILYGKVKKYDKALKEIAIIQKQNPKDYLSYKVQGLLLQDNKDLKAAADAFEMYLKLAPAKQVKDAEELLERIESLRKGQ